MNGKKRGKESRPRARFLRSMCGVGVEPAIDGRSCWYPGCSVDRSEVKPLYRLATYRDARIFVFENFG